MSRFFRCVLKNDIPGFRLRLAVPAHLCNGSWTPGGWQPPQTIESGASGSWQSERDWYLAGTSGWVKYDILNLGNDSKRAQLIIYWTNPYLGATYARRDIGASFTVADCDDDPPNNSSAFSNDNARPEDLHLDVVKFIHDGNVGSLENAELHLPGNLLPTFLLKGNIAERAEWHFRLRSTAPSTLLPGPKPKSKLVETKPAAADFAGDWVGHNIAVSLAHLGMGRFSVKVDDRTQREALIFETTAFLGTLNTAYLLTKRATLLVDHDPGIVERSVHLLEQLGAAVDRELATMKVMPVWAGIPRRDEDSQDRRARFFDYRFIAALAEASGVSNSEELVFASKALAEQAQVADYALLLDDNIMIYLVRLQEGNMPTGYELHYSRLGALGIPMVAIDLVYDLQIN